MKKFLQEILGNRKKQLLERIFILALGNRPTHLKLLFFIFCCMNELKKDSVNKFKKQKSPNDELYDASVELSHQIAFILTSLNFLTHFFFECHCVGLTKRTRQKKGTTTLMKKAMHTKGVKEKFLKWHLMRKGLRMKMKIFWKCVRAIRIKCTIFTSLRWKVVLFKIFS